MPGILPDCDDKLSETPLFEGNDSPAGGGKCSPIVGTVGNGFTVVYAQNLASNSIRTAKLSTSLGRTPYHQFSCHVKPSFGSPVAAKPQSSCRGVFFHLEASAGRNVL